MITLRPLRVEIEVREVEAGRKDAPELLDRIDALWSSARAERPGALFDGRLFDVLEVLDDENERAPTRIHGRFVSYRSWIAQRRDPLLAADLGIRPLAVTGLLRAREGLVLGRRSPDTTEDPGLWELVPSGGIDDSARVENGRIDTSSQLQRELVEEIGLPVSAVRFPEVAYLAWSEASGVFDLAHRMHVDMTAGEIARCFGSLLAGSEHPEYTEITVAKDGDLARFADENQTSELTRALLQAEGLLSRLEI